MAQKEFWAGSVGPNLYDDTSQYPDGELIEGARVPQAYIEDAPTKSHHAVTLEYLGTWTGSGAVSSVDSAVSRVESKLTSTTSKVDSRVDSALSKVESSIVSESTRADSVAQSLAASIVAGGGGTTDSGARSMATSAVTRADSRVDSASLNTSTADSKGASAAAAASVADSKAVSAASAGGDVTAASNLTDNAVVRGDGGSKGVQTSTLVIDDNGRVTNSSQPAFLVNLTARQSDATGDATIFTVPFNSEIFDQGNNFASYTFTAPVTGKFVLHASVYIEQLSAAHTLVQLTIATSNRSYTNQDYNTSNPLVPDRGIDMTIVADMDTSDTATVTIRVSGSTKTIDVYGDATSIYTSFSGFLAC